MLLCSHEEQKPESEAERSFFMKHSLSLILCAVLLVTALTGAGMAVSANAAEQKTSLAGFVGKVTSSNLPDLFPQNNRQPAERGPWLPDPCNVLGVSGEYVKSYQVSGTTIKYYSYELDDTFDGIGDKISTYNWALCEELGYEIYRMNETGDMFAARALEKDGETAELYLFIIDDNNYQNAYSEVTWEVVLAVPDTMYFRLGEKTPGIINGENVCPSCEGSTKCAFCHGSGRYNYGAGYETCVNCDGTKICNICGGVGY